MSTMDRLQEEIDRSFGDGPAQRPLEEHLAGGHRALRRRRAAITVGALATVAILGTSYAVVSSGPQSQAGPDPAGTPTASPSPTDAVTVAPWGKGEVARYSDGDLEIRPGARVREQINNPYRYEPPEQSVALDLTYNGQRRWMTLEETADGGSSMSAVPSNGWASFEDWVADQVGEAIGDGNGWPRTVRLTDEGQVVAATGATILQRTDDPGLGDSFAPKGATTGAAVVEVDGAPPSYFVVWRVIDGELDVITTPPRDVVGATFDELLTYARSQYASGEGLR
ncbi:MAG: hypothetical protein WBP61_17860 [Nocardioides sp.]